MAEPLTHCDERRTMGDERRTMGNERRTMATDGSNIGINTRLAHSGNNPRDYFGFVNPPVVHAST
ncbi:MAG: hypothetical protein E5X96_05795, partial [Mesorhizobium sp.]